MKTLVDNFAVLGVEFCLLEDLMHVFAPETVMQLDNDLIKSIAAESDASMMERSRTAEKSRVFENSLHILNRYRRHKQNGRY